jgi:hypothetical protein
MLHSTDKGDTNKDICVAELSFRAALVAVEIYAYGFAVSRRPGCSKNIRVTKLPSRTALVAPSIRQLDDLPTAVRAPDRL